jgi:hypothetical protein
VSKLKFWSPKPYSASTPNSSAPAHS